MRTFIVTQLKNLAEISEGHYIDQAEEAVKKPVLNLEINLRTSSLGWQVGEDSVKERDDGLKLSR